MSDTTKSAALTRDATVDSYVEEFDAYADRRAAEPSWLQLKRRAAIDAFGRLGFPTPRQEDWRFTNVAPIASAPIPRASLPANPAMVAGMASLPALDLAAELVFVNGVYEPSLSSVRDLPPGTRIGRFDVRSAGDPYGVQDRLGEQAQVDRHPFVALNAALFEDSAVVALPAGCRVERPIHLVFLAESPSRRTAIYPRVLVTAGPGSEVRLIESYLGRPGQEYFTNAVSEIIVGEESIVDHYRIQRESARAYHVGGMHVRCARQGRFSSHSISLGGALVRNDVAVVLDGEGASCVLNGLYAADGDALVDNHTAIDHAQPHCESHELYKGVLGGRARGVFHGKIVVRQDAQKTDAKQTNKALLLSDHAQINSKPQLEIFANDVKCTHGAAVGQLDDEAIFYLRARGVGSDAARRMLIEAFVGDVLGRIRLTSLQVELESPVRARLRAMLEAPERSTAA